MTTETTTAQPLTVRFKLPGREAPGYLRRTKRFALLDKRLASGEPDALDEWIEVLADYAINMTKAEAIEALWEASQEEIEALTVALRGGNPMVPASS